MAEHVKQRVFKETDFRIVFRFSMNGEVVHTESYPIARHLFALCLGQKTAPLTEE
jgi:hypothetical protein